MNLPGISRPLRAAGLALLGVAVIAVAIGTVTAVTGDADQDTAAPGGEQTTTTAPEGGDGGQSPTSEASEAPSDPSETATTEPDDDGDRPGDGDGADGGADDGADGGADGEAPATTDRPGGKDDTGKAKYADSLKSVDVRVYNNSNISGLAERAARDLRARGWNVVEVGNYSDGVIHTTTVYYREGTKEEASAQAIGENYSMRVEPRFDGIEDASPGVIVIVTKDYDGRQTGK